MMWGGETAPTAGLPPRWSDLVPLVQTQSLEQGLCRLLDTADIEITGSGSAALAIAFEYLARRQPHRRTVIVPGYTCPLVVLAAAARGLRCIACDTVANGFELDLDILRQLMGPDTLAVVPTHYGGVLTDAAGVAAAAKAVSPEIAVVEDAAQAFGATVGGGSVGFAGDIGVFSFGAGKGFTLFEGGALVARDPSTVSQLRLVASELEHASWLGELKRQGEFIGYHALYGPLGLRLVFGLPKRFWLRRGNDLRAAGDLFDRDIPMNPVGRWRRDVGARALVRYPKHLACARRQFDRIHHLLAGARFMGLPGARLYPPQPGQCPSATSMFVTLPDYETTAGCIHSLWQSRLGVARMFTRAIGDYPDLAGDMIASETPNARRLAARTITVSTAPSQTPDQLDAIVCAIEANLPVMRSAAQSDLRQPGTTIGE